MDLVTPRQCLDMLYLSHYWLGQKRGVEPYRALVLFYTLRHMGLISESQRRRLAGDAELRAMFLKEAASYRVRGTVVKQHLVDLRENSRHLVILIVNPGDMVRYPRIFGANGYHMLLTEAGEQYASQIANDYEITAELLVQGWAAAKREIARKFGVLRNQRTDNQ